MNFFLDIVKGLVDGWNYGRSRRRDCGVHVGYLAFEYTSNAFSFYRQCRQWKGPTTGKDSSGGMLSSILASSVGTRHKRGFARPQHLDDRNDKMELLLLLLNLSLELGHDDRQRITHMRSRRISTKRLDMSTVRTKWPRLVQVLSWL